MASVPTRFPITGPQPSGRPSTKRPPPRPVPQAEAAASPWALCASGRAPPAGRRKRPRTAGRRTVPSCVLPAARAYPQARLRVPRRRVLCSRSPRLARAADEPMPKRSSGSAAAFWVLCSPGGARTPCLSLPGPTSPLIAGHLPGMLHQSFPSLGSPLCASLPAPLPTLRLRLPNWGLQSLMLAQGTTVHSLGAQRCFHFALLPDSRSLFAPFL